jgi:5-methylcytosine-specific restriction endonuclease McrBC regulatory subunit McrC
VRITLRAGPNGHTSGIAVLAGGNTTLVVTVLPKLWRDGQRQVTDVRLSEGPTVFATVHEGDALRLQGSPSVVGTMVTALTEAQVTDLGAAGSLLQIAHIDETDFVLVHRPMDDQRSLLDFLHLLDRTRFAIGDDRVSASSVTHPALRLMLHRRFVAAVEPLLRDVRPLYLEADEDLTMPRGRLLDRSLVLHALTGRPAVLCRFDEQTYDTPLLRVVSAALHTVVHASAPAQLADMAVGLRSRAVVLLRALAQVQVLDRARAVHVGRTLRLSRLEQRWSDVLSLALRVLTHETAGMSTAADSIEAYELLVPTEKLWERVVGGALERTGGVTVRFHGDDVGAGHAVVVRPWSVAGTSEPETLDLYPDFLLTVGRRDIWCLDAKYKLPPPSGPSSADAYQLFAYSHLASLDSRQVAVCGLIYPRSSRTSSANWLHRAPAEDTPLMVGSIPFPASSDVASLHAWDAYLTSSAAALGDLIAHAPTGAAVS